MSRRSHPRPVEQAYQLGYQDGLMHPEHRPRRRQFDDPTLAQSYDRGVQAGQRDAQLQADAA